MIWGDRKAQPLAVLIPHVGLPVYSATFVTSPHRPDHIVLVTAVSVPNKLSIHFLYSSFFCLIFKYENLFC